MGFFNRALIERSAHTPVRPTRAPIIAVLTTISVSYAGDRADIPSVRPGGLLVRVEQVRVVVGGSEVDDAGLGQLPVDGVAAAAPARSRRAGPTALAAFQVHGIGLDSREAPAVLALAPDPSTAATLTPARLRMVLRRSGRQTQHRGLGDAAASSFTGEYLHQLPLVEVAMGRKPRRC
jgi:hypothetical protein